MGWFMRIKSKDMTNKILYLIFGAIFFQQVFVINLGSSLKIYDLLSPILLIIIILKSSTKMPKLVFLLFVFFVLSPLVSNLYNLSNETVSSYYIRFPEAIGSMRFNKNLSPWVIWIYDILCWVTIFQISCSEYVYKNKIIFIRLYVNIGILVCIYSLYGVVFVHLLGFPDIIPSIVDLRNTKPDSSMRPAGFSSEPGTYIIMLCWQLLFLIYIPKIFNRIKKVFYISITLVVLLLTLSSILAGFLIIIIVVNFVLSKKRKLLFFIMSIVTVLISIAINFLKLNELVYYSFFYKIQNFLKTPTHTLGSGAFRAYTNLMGVEVFKESPLFGVGVSNSYYHLWKYEFSMGIGAFGERITHSVPPQSSFIMVLSEQGLVGFLLLLCFCFWFLLELKYLKNNDYFRIAIIGGLTTFMVWTTIYPIYNLFFWINLALIINEIKFTKQLKEIF